MFLTCSLTLTVVFSLIFAYKSTQVQVIDYLKAFIKRQHIERLQRNECTIELGFILTDIVTTLGRVSDHCSNIAGCLIEISNDRYDLHEYFQGVKSSGDEFERNYNHFMLKYGVR